MILNVPEDWTVQSLSSIAKVSIGLVTTMTEHYVNSGVPLIRNSDIKENRITKEKLINLNPAFAEQYPTRTLNVGDIVTVHTGDVGVSAKIDDELNGCLGFATLNTRVNLDMVDPEYLCWYFNNPRFLAHCVSLSTGDGRQNLNLKDFAKVQVPIPPIPEQKKIAQILSTWDKAITTTEQLLANSQQQKKALMQQLLTGKKRLLDENGVRFSGEWRRKPLKDTVEIIYGKSPKEVVEPTGLYPIYGTGGIGGYASEALCEERAVLIGRKGTIDRPLFISEPFWAIDTTFYCLPKSDTDLKWFYYLVSSLKLRSYSEASGVPSLSRETLNSIKILVPDAIEEQQKIAAVLSLADQEISALQEKIDALKQEKKALMQQLLTGKLRVKVQ